MLFCTGEAYNKANKYKLLLTGHVFEWSCFVWRNIFSIQKREIDVSKERFVFQFPEASGCDICSSVNFLVCVSREGMKWWWRERKLKIGQSEDLWSVKECIYLSFSNFHEQIPISFSVVLKISNIAGNQQINYELTQLWISSRHIKCFYFINKLVQKWPFYGAPLS